MDSITLTDEQIQGGKEMKSKTRFKILGILTIIITLIGGFIAYKRHESREKYYALYRHGFQLLQEQIPYYIVENYSGVSKVEFSPIFIDTGSPFQYISVVPVIYDEEGNRALMSGDIDGDGNRFPSFGISQGQIEVLSLDIFNNHRIVLSNSYSGNEIDVSGYEKLPDKGKIQSDELYDRIITELVEKNFLKNIKKNSDGSPDAEVMYNLEIEKGDWTTWR